MLQDGGRKYMGGIEELLGFAESTVSPPFDRSEDDERDWTMIARQQCEVGHHALRTNNSAFVFQLESLA